MKVDLYELRCTLCPSWLRHATYERSAEVMERHEATRHKKAKTTWRTVHPVPRP